MSDIHVEFEIPSGARSYHVGHALKVRIAYSTPDEARESLTNLIASIEMLRDAAVLDLERRAETEPTQPSYDGSATLQQQPLYARR